MKSSIRRTMELLRQHLLRDAVPDMSDWSETEQLVWYLHHGQSTTQAALNVEEELRAEKEALKQQPGADEATSLPDEEVKADAPPSDPPPIAAAPPMPRAPEPEPVFPPLPSTLGFTPDADEQRRIDFMNERTRWRERTEADYYWERSGGGVIHEYDPLAEE